MGMSTCAWMHIRFDFPKLIQVVLRTKYPRYDLLDFGDQNPAQASSSAKLRIESWRSRLINK